MRISSLSSSVFLILLIQFASVQAQSITGTWFNPSTLSAKSSICCIPDSIKIESSWGKMVATYNLPAIYMNQPCLSLFGSVTRATIDLSKQSTNLYFGSKYSQMSMRTGNFYYEVIGSSTLRIYTSSYSGFDQCAFSYSSHTGGSNPNTGGDGLPEVVKIILYVFVVILICFCSYAKKQHSDSMRQNTVVVQSNHNSNWLVSVPPQNVYAAPNNNIQFSHQAYVAPNHMNTNPVFVHNANTFAAPSQNAYAPANNVYVAPGDAYMAHQQAAGGNEYAPPQSAKMNGNHYAPYSNL